MISHKGPSLNMYFGQVFELYMGKIPRQYLKSALVFVVRPVAMRWRSRPLPLPVSKSTRTQSSGIPLPKFSLSETSSLWRRGSFFVLPPSSVLLTIATSFSLIHCLNPADAATSPSSKASQDSLRIEAAHVIASLSYGPSLSAHPTATPERHLTHCYLGSEEALGTLLRANAHHAIFYAISHFTKADPPLLRAAFSRALRALAASIADVVGPSLWGLKQDNSIVRNEAQQALQYFFQVRPSILHSFQLVDYICYRLKPSTSIFHSSSYQPLQLLRPLFHLLFSRWPHPQHKCSRALLERLSID